MENQFSRTERLLGKENMEKLAAARVCIFGIGGVGGYVAEALARSGVGHLELVDNDVICLSNLNRQIIATHETLGQYKVDVMKERILSINPTAEVTVYKCFYLPETRAQFDFTNCDYVVDAIDTVSGKLAIIENAKRADVPVISSMGAGNKVNPAAFEVADLYETSICPLAKVMRHECRKRGIDSLKVVYSKEVPVRPLEDASGSSKTQCASPSGNAGRTVERRAVPGSTAFVPSVAGLIIAGEIVNDLCKGCRK